MGLQAYNASTNIIRILYLSNTSHQCSESTRILAVLPKLIPPVRENLGGFHPYRCNRSVGRIMAVTWVPPWTLQLRHKGNESLLGAVVLLGWLLGYMPCGTYNGSTNIINSLGISAILPDLNRPGYQLTGLAEVAPHDATANIIIVSPSESGGFHPYHFNRSAEHNQGCHLIVAWTLHLRHKGNMSVVLLGS